MSRQKGTTLFSLEIGLKKPSIATTDRKEDNKDGKLDPNVLEMPKVQ